MLYRFLQRVAPDGLKGRPVSSVVPNLDDQVDPATLADFPLFSRTHDEALMADFRTIYWFRRPDDCLHSYYAMMSKRNQTKAIGDFVKKVGPKWLSSIDKAMETHSKTPENIILNDYSDYLIEPAAVMKRTADFADLKIGDSIEAIVTKENRLFRKGEHSKPDGVQAARGAEGHASDNYAGDVRDYVLGELMAKYEAIRDVARAARSSNG